MGSYSTQDTVVEIGA